MHLALLNSLWFLFVTFCSLKLYKDLQLKKGGKKSHAIDYLCSGIKSFPSVNIYFHVSMCVLDLFLYIWQTQGASGSFGTGYCLMLFSFWCLVCAYLDRIFLFSALHYTAWKAAWLAGSLAEKQWYRLSSSWWVISRIPVPETNRKGWYYCILWKEDWYQTNVCVVLSFCASARRQQCPYTWIVSRSNTATDYSWT